MAALDDSVFVKGSYGSWTTYTAESPQQQMPQPVRSGFSGDVWIATIGAIQPFFEPVMDSMTELNPQLTGT